MKEQARLFIEANKALETAKYFVTREVSYQDFYGKVLNHFLDKYHHHTFEVDREVFEQEAYIIEMWGIDNLEFAIERLEMLIDYSNYYVDL